MTATIYLDNQSIIRSLNHIKPQPGQYILSQAYDTANRITTCKHGLRHCKHLKVAWILGHDNTPGNEEADSLAKDAVNGKCSERGSLPQFICASKLPCSMSATQKAYREEIAAKWSSWWRALLRYAQMVKLDPSLPTQKFLKNITGLTRAQASLLTQLWTRPHASQQALVLHI